MIIELSSDGALQSPDLHDGCFYGIVAENGKLVKLLVRDHHEKPYEIVLGNVGSMNVTCFWGGDIILDVSLLPIGKAPPHMLKALFQDRITEEDKIAEAVAKNPRQYLFALESSYGADIYATCDKMQIRSDTNKEDATEVNDS
jgi:hypothetical protein